MQSGSVPSEPGDGALGGTAAAADLSSCDREPIHIPGAIQPHGLLFAFTEGDGDLVSVSANVADLAGRQPAELTGHPVESAFDDASRARLLAARSQAELAAGPPVLLQFPAGAGMAYAAIAYDGILHRHDGLGFLELEPRGDGADDSHAFFRRTRGAIRRLQAAGTLAEACGAAASEVRLITGFDRVMVYRFAADASGEVVAESRVETIDSFFGLHFPPSDIPAQSRALYALNPIRVIPDINYRPAPLVPDRNPVTGGPIDLSYAVLRSVSPIHLEYMANMGVHGTMSVSILRGERLWGLIACHNRAPRHVGHDARQACEMVAQVLAWQIGVMEEAAVSRHGLKGKAIQRRLLGDIEQLRDHRAGLIRNSEALLELMGASGLCLYGRDAATTIGRTPPAEAIESLVDRIDREGGTELFESDRLGTRFPETAQYAAIASGVLAVPLSRSSPRRIMLWFRPEVAQTVRWGGNPNKPVVLGPHGARLQPRSSFAAWTEETRGRARPWESHEIAAAMEIRDLVIDVILRRAEELERVNTQLARSNEELESFAYVASHDLKEPLRHIEAFAGLLADSTRGLGDERLESMISGIEGSSRRLRNLINDLAEFSRLGRQAQPLAPARLDEIVREVILDLRQRIEEAAAELVCETLPAVQCDRNQMRQVLQNLLLNALKYRHPDRPCRIRIFAEAGEPEGRRGEVGAAALVRVNVRDNGIGFDPKYSEQVFEPFQRLHGPDEYEGSGIGLAICRKIVQRHGGTVSVTTAPGAGSTFSFSLPAAAELGLAAAGRRAAPGGQGRRSGGRRMTHTSGPGTAAPIDLTTCDREPIHIPGSIQPHGALLALCQPVLRPVSVSANIADFTGLAPGAMLLRPPRDWLTPDSLHRLEAALESADLALLNPVRIDLAGPAGGRACDGILHRHDGLTFLELEPRGQDDSPSSAFFRSVRGAIKRLQGAGTLAVACEVAAREVRRITGFDRVKIYRFAADWSGRVIAEDRAETIPSLYDFHFPASDIPAQSRALYTSNLVRIIPDIGYTPAPLQPDRNPLTGGPIDLSGAVLRSVSPVHIEYMVNMAVHGAMSVSIVRDGRLWGLISCHNTLPRFVSFEIRQACELIAQVLTWQIGVLEEAEVIRHSMRVRAVQNRLLYRARRGGRSAGRAGA